MEDWYRELLTDPAKAEQELLSDFEAHAGYLAQLGGRVLDVGGGVGLPARFLSADVDYWVVDPSGLWQEPAWAEFGWRARGTGPQPNFVSGAGEHLPFRDEHFDAALAFWSLNHVQDPELCIAEIGRVLRPGGTAYIVLEDIAPSWCDLARVLFERVAARLGREPSNDVGCPNFVSALGAKLAGRWPVEHDHVAVDEHGLARAAKEHLELRKRRWVRGYLTLEFARVGSAATSGQTKARLASTENSRSGE
jgi:SAM-dependent methyltransferase